MATIQERRVPGLSTVHVFQTGTSLEPVLLLNRNGYYTDSRMSVPSLLISLKSGFPS